MLLLVLFVVLSSSTEEPSLTNWLVGLTMYVSGGCVCVLYGYLRLDKQ